jgi:glutamyl-tRNA reductase
VAGLPGDLVTEVEGVALAEVARQLVTADVVFTTVGSDHPIVDRSQLAEAVAARTAGSPLVVVDLGVPRNVEPAAADLEGVTLLDMDALRTVVEDALAARHGELSDAQAIVADEVDRYRAASRARGAAPLVSALRTQAEEARRVELDRQRSKRTDLSEEQWEQVDAVTRSMVAKMLHQPTVVLKDAAGTARGERLTEALRSLFDL